MRDTSVEYRTSEKVLCFECHDRCLEVVLDKENMMINFRNKVLSFNFEESTLNNNSVDVGYENEQSIYVTGDSEGNLVYDFGADERDKQELFTYIVERAAGIVVSGNK